MGLNLAGSNGHLQGRKASTTLQVVFIGGKNTLKKRRLKKREEG